MRMVQLKRRRQYNDIERKIHFTSSLSLSLPGFRIQCCCILCLFIIIIIIIMQSTANVHIEYAHTHVRHKHEQSTEKNGEPREEKKGRGEEKKTRKANSTKANGKAKQYIFEKRARPFA